MRTERPAEPVRGYLHVRAAGFVVEHVWTCGAHAPADARPVALLAATHRRACHVCGARLTTSREA